MDIEYDEEEEVGSWNCSGDYVEILGQRYCGTSLPEPIISCNDLKVTFQSDNNAVFNKAEGRWSSGFRAVWTEIPDGSGHCLYSPPLTEGAECDYGQRRDPCEEGLDCTDGWCQGKLSLE